MITFGFGKASVSIALFFSAQQHHKEKIQANVTAYEMENSPSKKDQGEWNRQSCMAFCTVGNGALLLEQKVLTKAGATVNSK